jgi:hypothetical protein
VLVPDYVIPPAGVTAASFFAPAAFADPARPPVLLADDVDEKTGDWRSLFSRVHPVDAAIREAFRLERGTGAAVQNDGHKFRDIKKVGPDTSRQLEDEVRRILAPFVTRKDIEITTILSEAGVTSYDLGAVFVEYTNLHTRKQQKVGG